MTNGLFYAGLPAGGKFVDVSKFNRGFTTANANAAAAVAALGNSVYFNGSQTNGAISYGDVDWFAGLSKLTIVAVVQRNTSAGGTIFAKWGSIGQHEALIAVSSTGAVTFAVHTTGLIFGIWVSTAGLMPAEKTAVIAASWYGGVSAKLACNGVVQTPANTGGSVTGSIVNGTTVLQYGVAGDGSPFSGHIGTALAFNRSFLESELFSITTNPWQLFAPSRIYIPTATAAGYTHPNLSLATATEIGATSFKPRVTYTFA